MSKFGELALRDSIEDDDDSMLSQNGFSTIDLSNGKSAASPTESETKTTEITDDPAYTSFSAQNELDNNNNSNNYTSIYKNVYNHHQYAPAGTASSMSSSSSQQKGLSIQSILSGSSGNGSVSAQSVLATAGEASTKLATRTASTIESFKLWSKSAYRCTKQLVNERLGKTNRTVDPEIEASIDNLRENKKKYEHILGLSRSFSAQLQTLITTQKQLADSFAEMAQKSHDLIDEFTVNSETQRQLVRHGESLLGTLNLFVSSLTTLCHKTIEDTLVTIRNYEAARLEYDACKTDLDQQQQLSGTTQQRVAPQVNTLQQDLAVYKERYESLKQDVCVKIRFLDENRVKVMKKQLCLFQNAIAAYFTGNFKAVESIMTQFKVTEETVGDDQTKFQSFLEQ